MLAGASCPRCSTACRGPCSKASWTDLSPTPATQDGVNQRVSPRPVADPGTRAATQVLNPDSIVSVEFVGEYRVIKYPIEAGNFSEDYNKVKVPNVVKVICRKGGTSSDRSALDRPRGRSGPRRTSTHLRRPTGRIPTTTSTTSTIRRRAELGVALIQATICSRRSTFGLDLARTPSSRAPRTRSPSGMSQTQDPTPQWPQRFRSGPHDRRATHRPDPAAAQPGINVQLGQQPTTSIPTRTRGSSSMSTSMMP